MCSDTVVKIGCGWKSARCWFLVMVSLHSVIYYAETRKTGYSEWNRSKLSVLPKKEKGIVRSEWSSIPFLLCEDLILHLNQKLQCLNAPSSFKNTRSSAVLNQRSPQDEILQLSCAFFSLSVLLEYLAAVLNPQRASGRKRKELLWAQISSGNPVWRHLANFVIPLRQLYWLCGKQD